MGVSVVNALSSELKLKIFRENKEHLIEFKNGEALNPLAVNGKSENKNGTLITFLPDKNIFTNTDFDSKILKQRFREMAFLNQKITIVFSLIPKSSKALVRRPTILST